MLAAVSNPETISSFSPVSGLIIEKRIDELAIAIEEAKQKQRRKVTCEEILDVMTEKSKSSSAHWNLAKAIADYLNEKTPA